MVLGRYACQQFIDGSVTALVSGMHAVRREIHTARHGRVVRFDYLYVFECTKAYKATKRFALSNRALGRQGERYP